MKHKVELANETSPALKKQKTNEGTLKQNGGTTNVFTSLEFKNLLKDPETQTLGLNKFSRACDIFDSKKENTIDIVKSYISSSPDCVEIFKCFGAQNSTGSFGPIFRSFVCILTRTADDLKELYCKVSENVCSSIIRSHLQKVYRAVALRQSPRTITSALRLLSIMVMQGPDTAREVANNVDFSMRCFKEVLDFSKGKLGYEVRLSYIKFILSFFVSDDSQTMTRVLESHGSVSCIFKSMKSDPASIVQLVLTTLKEKAVKNMLVPKTAKAHFFAEPKLLSRIASLFEWDGVPDVTLDDPAGTVRDYIRQLVYEFIYHACCPFKYGINFRDRMLGIGDKSKNHVLLDFILHLVPLSSDPLICDLITEILKACPDLLPRFMNDFRLSLEPKDVEIWTRNFKIVEAAYASQPDVATALQQASSTRIAHSEEVKVSSESLVKMIIPGVFSLNFNAQNALRHCLKSKSLEIRRNSLSLIAHFLRKIKATSDFAFNQSNWEKSPYSCEEMEFIVSELKDGLLKTYISVPSIISCWSEISNEKSHEPKILLLQVLSLLQQTFPDALVDAKFDFTKLLSGIKISPQSTCQDEVSCASLTLKMLSQVTEQCRWFKAREGREVPFQKLLQVLYDTRSLTNGIYEEAVRLFEKILISNNIIDLEKKKEAQIWVSHLVPRLKTHNDMAVLKFLTNVCGCAVRMPINYMQILSSQEKKKNVFGDMLKVGDEFWNSLPDVEIQPRSTGLVDLKKYEDLTFVNAAQSEELVTEATYPMSLLSVAVLESLRDSSSLGSEERVLLDQFLSQVFYSLFHIISSAADAKFFASIFNDIVSSIPEFKASFAKLYNLSCFLALWSGNAPKGFKFQGNDPMCLLDGWLWSLFVKEKGKGKGAVSKFPLDDYCRDAKNHYHIDNVLPQCLLFFDTLFNISGTDLMGPTKELLCFIISMFRVLANDYTDPAELQEMISSEQDAVNGSNRDPGRDNCCDQSFSSWKLFLQTPSVQKLFLDNIFLQATPTDFLNMGSEILRKENYSLSGMCTSLVAKAVGLLYIDSKCPIDDNIDIFISRIRSSIPDLLKELTNSKKPKRVSNKQYLLFSVFSELEPLIPKEDIQLFFDQASRLLPKVKSDDVAAIFSEFLSKCTPRLISDNSDKVSYASFTNVCNFLESDHLKECTKIITIIAHFLDRFPDLAIIAQTSLMDFCMQNLNPPVISLAAKLLQCNPCIVSYCYSSPEKLLDLSFEEKIKIVPLMFQVITILSTMNFSDESKAASCLLKKILKAYRSLLQCEDIGVIFRTMKVGTGNEFIKRCLIASLKLGDHGTVSHLVTRLDALDHYNESSLAEITTFCQILFEASKFFKDAANIKAVVFATLLKVAMAMKDKKSSMVYIELLTIIGSITAVEWNVVQSKITPIWARFLKYTLKNHFHNEAALRFLTEMVRIEFDWAKSSELSENVPDVATIRDMLISHSKFLPAIFEDNLVKEALTDLLFTLTLRCTLDQLSSKDLGFLLGSYGGTLSYSDQNVLKMILVHEQKGVDLSSFRPFLWGQTALSSYRARKNLGETLWKKPGPSEVLSCIDKTIMDATLSRFPLRRRMICTDQDVKDESSFKNDPFLTIIASKNAVTKDPQPSNRVYDPCFLLPVIFDVLNPQNLVDCKLIVRTGVLSFLMCCLSSHCHVIRSLSATCLCLYYQHAQTAWFPENNLTMYVIRCIRNSIESKSGKNDEPVIPRLSSVVANFFSNLVSLHSTPEEHMFAVLHRFLLVKPVFDLKNVPEFYVLFFSAEMESKVERTWILNLISQSLRDMGDYHVIKKKNVFQLIMCLHDSPISDNYSRRQVFEILEQVCSIRSAANDLVKNNGLIPWLTEVAYQQPCNDFDSDDIGAVGVIGKRQENTNHVIRVMSTLWKTLNTSDFVAEEILEKEDDDEARHDKHASLAPFRVVKQLINLGVTLVENLTKMKDLHQNNCDYSIEVLNVLESCLSNLDERRKLANIRRKESIDNADDDMSDLQNEHIAILLKITDSFVKKEICSLLKIVTFWEPQSEKVAQESHDYRLWTKVIAILLGTAFQSWSKDSTWIEQNFMKFLKWLQMWTSLMEKDLCISMKSLLAKCYGIICCNISTLGWKSWDCIKILNGILDSDTDATYSVNSLDILSKMNAIRTGLLPKE